jgi:hypothetical protein
MENIWIATVELEVEPGDMPSGDTLGFMRITMWASSRPNLLHKIEEYLFEYKWKPLSVENVAIVDPSQDYGEEVNQMIDETSQDHNAVRLGTFYSYKPD